MTVVADYPLLNRLRQQLPSAEFPVDVSYAELPDRLVAAGLASPEDMLALLRSLYGTPYARAETLAPTPEALATMTLDLCKFWRCLPLAVTPTTLVLAMADAWDQDALEFVRIRSGRNVEPIVCLHGALQEAALNAYSSTAALGLAISDLVGEAGDDDGGGAGNGVAIEQADAPIIKLVNYILEQGLAAGASDVHLEPTASGGRVRFRIDGRLHEMIEPPGNLYRPVISRLKVMSNLDVSETRFPQDGRITLPVGRRTVDFRVSTIPFADGEGVVLRILDKTGVALELRALGFPDDLLPLYNKAIRSPHGLVLVAGPTGSGKSTTLYATIGEILSPEVKVISVEDPVEFRVAGMEQSPIREDIGYTFEMGLRAILRHDPDVVMIGEMRDQKSAEIAVRAALTGHLVFSTIHTNDSLQAVTRLINMGIPDYLVKAVLRSVLSQRLTRKLCPECREPHEIERDLLAQLGLDELALAALDKTVTVYRGTGCPACHKLGYKGRIAIYEVLDAETLFRNISLEDRTQESMLAKARQLGLRTLRQNGLRMALDGVTSVEEIAKVTADF